MREIPFTAKQIAAELRLELFDGARERRLRDVTFLSRAGEIEHPCQGEKISHLMHFHCAIPTRSSALEKYHLKQRAIARSYQNITQRIFQLQSHGRSLIAIETEQT